MTTPENGIFIKCPHPECGLEYVLPGQEEAARKYYSYSHRWFPSVNIPPDQDTGIGNCVCKQIAIEVHRTQDGVALTQRERIEES